MPDVSWLPHANAILNAAAATALTLGWRAIRRGDRDTHRRAMLTAFCLSVLFLVGYLVYHYAHGSTRFPEDAGWIRIVYLVVLATHTVLAAAVPILAVLVLRWGLRGEFTYHKRLARWTLPIWLYVSVTGVIVYATLYHLAPRLGGAS